MDGSIPAEIRIERDKLLYNPMEQSGVAKDAAGMLDAFLNLANSDDAEIVRYAKKWGVLGLCQHNLPADHGDIVTFRWVSSYCARRPRPFCG